MKNIDFLELGSEILAKGKNLRFHAMGGSMHPFIQNGDIVEVAPVAAKDIKLGDIIFFRNARGKPVVHRVVRRPRQEDSKIMVVTKGDSTLALDGIISDEQVLGKVILIERNGVRIDLSAGFNRYLGKFWGIVSPHTALHLPVRQAAWFGAAGLRPVASRLGRLKLYRRLARSILPTGFSFEPAEKDKLFLLKQLYSRAKKFEAQDPLAVGQALSGRTSKLTLCIIAKKKGQIIGSVMLRQMAEPKDTYEIFGLFVRFRYRFRGIGEKLASMAVAEAQKQGAAQIVTGLSGKAPAAIKLFEKMGFTAMASLALRQEAVKDGQTTTSVGAITLAKQIG